MALKGYSQLWDRADLDTGFLTLKRVHPLVHLEFPFNLRSVLLEFHSFTEKLVFECAFAHPILAYGG